MTTTPWPRIRDLPPDHQAPFAKWLEGQTLPWLEGVPPEEQDGYYIHDYERWLAKLPVIEGLHQMKTTEQWVELHNRCELPAKGSYVYNLMAEQVKAIQLDAFLAGMRHSEVAVQIMEDRDGDDRNYAGQLSEIIGQTKTLPEPCPECGKDSQ